MNETWQTVEGTGWLSIPEFGRINPRQDNVNGGRQYFTAELDNGEYAEARGEAITGGPSTWHFDFDQSFLLADRNHENCLETEISLLPGGIFCVRYRAGAWAPAETGGW